MIVRCNNCESAFSVDDDKVANKIFAFTCPKCSTENIVNNKIKDKQKEKEESILDDDLLFDSGTNDTKTADNEIPEPSFEDDIELDLTETKPSDDKNKKLNLEIEESEGGFDIESDDSIFEEPLNDTSTGKKEDENIFTEESSFDLEEIESSAADEFDIELKKDTDIVKDDGDAILDDFNIDDDLISEVDDHLLNDENIDSLSNDLNNKARGESSDKIEAESDDLIIDLEDIDITSDDELSKAAELSGESANGQIDKDDLAIDMDSLDIELEDTSLDDALADHVMSDDEKNTKKEPNKDNFDDEDIKLNLDELDIDIDDVSTKADTPTDDEFDKMTKLSGESANGQIDKEDLTIDMDSLDIELEDTSLDDALADHVMRNDEKDTKKEQNKDDFDDEDIKLNLDELDIDIDDVSTETDQHIDDEFDKMTNLSDESDNGQIDREDLTIDMDSLDIELVDTSLDALADHIISHDEKNTKKEQDKDDFDDEDIKLNLDELDIDIEEIEGRELVSKDDTKAGKHTDDEDDEKLTLDDAGLTFDELAPKDKKDDLYEQPDEEIKLTLEDIDPDLSLEEIIETAEADSKFVLDTLEELPEIYNDEENEIIQTKNNRISRKTPANIYDDIIADNSDYDIIDDYDDSEFHVSSHGKRDTSFSVDFSLKYSRIQAFLRLLFLYFISMIPHFVVLIIYSVLSAILGFINQLVILSTGRCVEDFGLIIENTVRYVLYIQTNLIGIVDDRPVFSGRKYIDHALQFDVTFPFKYSKGLAIIRLSIIGIIIFTLPHIIIMILLSLIAPICYLIGMLSVIFTKRWPRIFFIYLAKYFRYIAQVSSFMLGLTDEYPPFKF